MPAVPVQETTMTPQPPLPDRATVDELQRFLASYPECQFMEVMVPDINGVLRGKRIPRAEFEALFEGGLKGTASTCVLKIAGDIAESMGLGLYDGDPDKLLYPVASTLAPMPWLASDTVQVLASLAELDGEPCYYDPRHILRRVMQRLANRGLRAVVATELEFYLVEQGPDGQLQPRLPHLAGTGLRQPGNQYSMTEDLWELDDFLEQVRQTGEMQQIPVTTVHSEFAAGQLEINLHHVDDVVTACDHAVLMKRMIKGWPGSSNYPPVSWPNPLPSWPVAGCTFISACMTRRGTIFLPKPTVMHCLR